MNKEAREAIKMMIVSKKNHKTNFPKRQSATVGTKTGPRIRFHV